MKILIVDDERPLLRALAMNMTARGYQVTEADTGTKALTAAAADDYDVILLDLGLPDLSGMDVIRAVREYGTTPIIVLSARTGSSDKVTALDLGADDYVTKPFSPRELAARVRTVLRRARQAPESVERLVFDDIELDAGMREVVSAGERLHLTAREFDLLFFLASNPGHVFSRDQLMTSVWGYSSALDTGTVTVHIRRLRSKIEADPANPAHLQTVWGVGYRFVA
jgi:DNA-binding response OmpR family regulator